MAIGFAMLGTAACVTASGQSSGLHWSNPPRRIVLENAIYLTEVNADGNEEQRPEWTEAARRNLVKNVTEYLGDRVIEVVVATEPTQLPRGTEIQNDYGADYHLYFVQSRAYPRSRVTARNAGRVAWNAIELVGAIIGPLGCLSGRGCVTHDPRFVPIERGIMIGAAELFDTRTGVQIWRRDITAVDLREERSTRRMVVNVLHDVK
jgi:hypothetical protein